MSSLNHNHALTHTHALIGNNKQKAKDRDCIIHNMNSITKMGMSINPHKISQNMKKKDSTTFNCNQAMKRPQTPDPVSNRAHQSVRYPEPQIILREIQKNVNVLKQMYYASLTQHNNSHSMKSSRDDILGQSHHTQQSNHQDNYCSQSGRDSNALRKSFDMIAFNKKSVPEITMMPNIHPNIPFNNKSFNSKLFEQFCGGSDKNQTLENRQKDKNLKQTRNKQKQHKQQIFESKSREKPKSQHKKSTKNLHKNAKKVGILKQDLDKQVSKKLESYQKYSTPHNETVAQKVKTNQNNGNINSLFEIFKFYKKSIDSTLSKNSQANTQNSQKTSIHNMNTYVSTKNHTNSQIHQDKSYAKDTANNSSTKITTGNKNSTAARPCGSSIEVSMDVSVEQDPLKNSTKGKSRNSSAENSSKKNKKKSKSKNQFNEGKAKKPLQKKDDYRQLSKNYYNQIHCKKTKHQSKNKGSTKVKNNKIREEQDFQKPTLKEQDIRQQNFIKQTKTQRKQENQDHPLYEIWKKKTSSSGIKNRQRDTESISQNPERASKISKRIKEDEEKIQLTQFPEIQSSLFDRNMPILEQDSRQEASSELIALTNCKDNSSNNFNKNNQFQFTKISKLNLNPSESSSISQQQKKRKFGGYEEAAIGAPHSPVELAQKMNIYQIKGEQNTRFPTPSFVSSDVDEHIQKNSKQFHFNYIKNQTQNIDSTEITKKLSCFSFKQKQQSNRLEDSLLGFQIPKRQSDDSDLDNFELVSFQL